jgi:hypothetical protein
MHVASPTSPAHVEASSDIMKKSFSATLIERFFRNTPTRRRTGRCFMVSVLDRRVRLPLFAKGAKTEFSRCRKPPHHRPFTSGGRCPVRRTVDRYEVELFQSR